MFQLYQRNISFLKSFAKQMGNGRVDCYTVPIKFFDLQLKILL